MRRKAFLILSVFLAIFLSFSFLGATTYYVKNAGDDTKDGLSDANAWKTIAKVNASMGSFNPADSVLFNKGDEWQESLALYILDIDGSSGNPITFSSYGAGNKPIINGSAISTGWTVCDDPGTDNLLSNGKFTSDTTGWTAWGASTTLASVAGGQDGNCLQATRVSHNGFGAAQKITTNFAVGDKVQMSAYVKQGTEATYYMKLQYYTTSWSDLWAIGPLESSASWVRIDSGWQTVPAGTTELRAVVSGYATSGSVTILFDEICVYKTIYEKSFANTPKVVVEDGTLFTDVIEWNTNLVTTFSSASTSSWSVDGSNNCYVWCSDDADPDTHTMEVAANSGVNVYGIYFLGSNYIVIDGLECRYSTGEAIYLMSNIAYGTSQNNIVKNCTIYGAGGSAGIHMSETGGTTDNNTDNNLIEYNTISYCRQHGIHHTYGCSNNTSRHNVISYCGWGGFNAATGGHGISQWSNQAARRPAGNIIEYNTVHHTYQTTDGGEGTNIQCDNLTKNSIIRYNITYSSETTGIRVGNESSGCTVYYNICYSNNTSNGQWNGGFGTTGNTYDCSFYNNISYNNNGNGFTATGSGTTGLIVKNNIFFENSAYEIRLDANIDDANQLTCNYNCVYHSAGGNFMRDGGTEYNWSGWQGLGHDANSKNQDPKVIDAANGNFRLNPHSPCVNAGTDISLTEDYEGKKVRHAPDIGAYEDQTNVLFFGMQFNPLIPILLALFAIIAYRRRR